MIHLGLSILLIFTLINITHFELHTTENAIAGSIWTQSSDLDFNNGTSNNVLITSAGELELAQVTNYIEDDFIDGSKIDYQENLLLNTSMNEVRLLKQSNTFSKTFGGINPDQSNFIQQTSDKGFIIIGSTESYSPYRVSNSDGWLIKTESSGNEQWNKTFGGNNIDHCLSTIQN